MSVRELDVTSDDLQVTVFRDRTHGGLELENCFLLCYREFDVYMWIAPMRLQDHVRMRADAGEAKVRVVIAWGVIDPQRIHFLELPYLTRDLVPAMVHRIFAWPYAEARLSDFYGAQIWIENEPTNFGAIGTTFVSRRTLH